MDVSRAAAMLKNVDRMNVCARARMRDTHTSNGRWVAQFQKMKMIQWENQFIGFLIQSFSYFFRIASTGEQ